MAAGAAVAAVAAAIVTIAAAIVTMGIVAAVAEIVGRSGRRRCRSNHPGGGKEKEGKLVPLN